MHQVHRSIFTLIACLTLSAAFRHHLGLLDQAAIELEADAALPPNNSGALPHDKKHFHFADAVEAAVEVFADEVFSSDDAAHINAPLPANKLAKRVPSSDFNPNSKLSASKSNSSNASALALTSFVQRAHKDWIKSHAFPLSVFLVASMFVLAGIYVAANSSRKKRTDPPRNSVDLTSGCALDVVPFQEVTCKDLETRHLAWCSHGNALMMTHAVSDPLIINEVRAPWNDASLAQVLEEQGIPIAEWSVQARQQLLEELVARKTRIVRRGDYVMRVVELVVVVVEYPSENLVLQEASRCAVSRFGALPERTPASRRRTNETIVDTATRTLCEKLEFSPDMARVSEKALSIVDAEESFDFYRGLPSIVRKFVMKATVAEVQPSNPDKIGITSGRHQAGNVSYEWVPKQHAACFRKFRRGSSKRSSQAGEIMEKQALKPECLFSSVLEGLSVPILPWTETSIAEVLAAHDVESASSHFGVPLQQLTEMLCKGEVYFGADQATSRLLCITDQVCLGTAATDGRVVVQKHPGVSTPGTEKYSLPFQGKLSDESIWCAARRVAFGYFGHGGTSEQVCVHEHPAEQVLAKGALNISKLGHPTANMVRRVFLVSASIGVAPSEFQPRF